MLFVCVYVCFVCVSCVLMLLFFGCAFQWRNYYGLKYSTNLPINSGLESMYFLSSKKRIYYI